MVLLQICVTSLDGGSSNCKSPRFPYEPVGELRCNFGSFFSIPPNLGGHQRWYLFSCGTKNVKSFPGKGVSDLSSAYFLAGFEDRSSWLVFGVGFYNACVLNVLLVCCCLVLCGCLALLNLCAAVVV